MIPTPVLVGLVVLVAVVVVVTARRSHEAQRDPQRGFTAAQRQAGFARAGNRCEHLSIFGFRCRDAPTHGDHVFPWSRGGATTMANFQALCRSHNLRKSATVPSAFYVWRLQRRRRRYFPPTEPVSVVWRLGAPQPPRRVPAGRR